MSRLLPRIGMPRWLPATIGVLAALLALKSVTLLRAATGAGTMPSFLASDARASGGGDKPGSPATPPQQVSPTAATPAEPAIPPAERAVLLELRQRRQELDSREAALGEREAVLAVAQQRLSERIAELTALQKRLEALEAERRRQEDAGWQGLVRMYETMRPRDAATIMNDLSMPVLVQVMDRMKDAKAAAVIAAMDPDKARLLTQELARLRTRGPAEPQQAGATAPPPRPPGRDRPTTTPKG